MPNLVSLNLSSTKMGLRGCRELAEGCQNAFKLKILDLSNNNIEPEGFAKLLQKLKSSLNL